MAKDIPLCYCCIFPSSESALWYAFCWFTGIRFSCHTFSRYLRLPSVIPLIPGFLSFFSFWRLSSTSYFWLINCSYHWFFWIIFRIFISYVREVLFPSSSQISLLIPNILHSVPYKNVKSPVLSIFCLYFPPFPIYLLFMTFNFNLFDGIFDETLVIY